MQSPPAKLPDPRPSRVVHILARLMAEDASAAEVALYFQRLAGGREAGLSLLGDCSEDIRQLLSCCALHLHAGRTPAGPPTQLRSPGHPPDQAGSGDTPAARPAV